MKTFKILYSNDLVCDERVLSRMHLHPTNCETTTSYKLDLDVLNVYHVTQTLSSIMYHCLYLLLVLLLYHHRNEVADNYM